MKKQFLLLSSLLGIVTSLALPDNYTIATNDGTLLFEDLVLKAFEQIEKYAPASAQPYLEIYDLAVAAPGSLSLPKSTPVQVRVRALDIKAKQLFTAQSLVNPPMFTLSDRPLDEHNVVWRSFKFPAGLGHFTYSRAIDYMQGMARVADLNACRIGIPPKDPFQYRSPPTSVLWICVSRTGSPGDLLVLKASNGALGHFTWEDLGIDKTSSLAMNSSSIAWAS